MKLPPDVTKILTEARAEGWRIDAKDGEIVITPPKTLADDAQRKRIADAVARIARSHIGYCYEGCA